MPSPQFETLWQALFLAAETPRARCVDVAIEEGEEQAFEHLSP